MKIPREPLESLGDDDRLIDYRGLWEQFMTHDDRGLLLIGSRRVLLAINPSARTMLGYEGEVGRLVGDVVPDAHFGFAVGEALHDRQAIWHETYAPNPDRLLRFHLVPIMAENEAPVFVVASIDDITHVRHLETVRRDFVANVSHELRTPLASINLLVETLQRGAMRDPEAGGHFLRRIEVETQAMSNLVEELLELSRLETGILSLALQPVAVNSIFDVVINRLALAAEEKHIEVRHDVQEPAPKVRADPKRLEQVLMNLIHNAIKFTPSGGRVSLHAARKGPGVQIDVVDTGMGMSSAEAARVFERFYKVDRGRNRAEGAGLGLAIARHLLELHGSRLHVVSEVGRGSRFSFALPVAD